MATTDPARLAESTPAAPEEASQEVIGRSPWQLVWLRLKQDKAALVGLGFIIFLILIALGAPIIWKWISPSTCTVVKGEHSFTCHGPNDLHNADPYTTGIGLPGMGPLKTATIPARVADPQSTSTGTVKDGPYIFGVDQLGRDVFVRTIYGARTSLLVAVLATGCALSLGILMGLTAGFFGGWVDTLISRFIDIVLSMPLLVFAIGIAAACGASKEGCLGGLVKPGIPLVIFIITLFSWTYVARIIRGNTLSIREREFVEAARSIGSSNRRIMFRELLPNLIAPIIIYGSLLIPANISFEAYLSFFGLGAPPNTPSWGSMIADAVGVYEVAWWYMLFPGLALLMTTLAFNLLGDGLRDALDPKTGR